jgi:hypothetical protein
VDLVEFYVNKYNSERRDPTLDGRRAAIKAQKAK